MRNIRLTLILLPIKIFSFNLLHEIVPFSGIIMSIRKCLTEDSRIFSMLVTKEPETWQAIVRQINTMLHQIIEFILDLLAGRIKPSPSPLESKDGHPRLADFGTKDVATKTRDTDGAASMKGNGRTALRQELSSATNEPDARMDTTPAGDIRLDLGDVIPETSSKGEELNHMSPSFGKMGEEIEKLVMGLGSEDEGDGDDGAGASSLEHQLILTCCWLTLKVKLYCSHKRPTFNV